MRSSLGEIRGWLPLVNGLEAQIATLRGVDIFADARNGLRRLSYGLAVDLLRLICCCAVELSYLHKQAMYRCPSTMPRPS